MALREIHLHGKLGKKYGEKIRLDVRSPAEALRALSIQFPGFEEQLREGAYRVVRGDLETGLPLKHDELELGLGQKPLHIIPTPVAAGLETIVIVGLTLVAAVGLSLAFMPTIEPPDPNSREGAEQRNSGVFDGPVNVTEQGHPVPLVFGTMRVGSVVGAASIDTSDDRPNYVNNGGGGSGYGGSYGTGGFFGDLLDNVYSQLQKGGKGGGSKRAAEEVPNSLQSNATARIIDIVSEGEIGGLVDGLKSVYLDDTPVQNADDTYNFKGFALDERLGLPDQPPVLGFNSVETSSAVSTEVTIASGPVERTVTTTTIDRIRVTLGVQAFYSQNTENGDIAETNATVAIDVAEDGGSFGEVGRMTFDGKTNDQYQRSFTFAPPTAGNGAPWTVRARRITPDSTTSALQNSTYFDIITELTDVKLTYPDTAYYALTVDAKQFGADIPTRSYEIKGIKILVPSNYNPETRVYTGVWDGTFKTAWTDNPAWIFYNLLVNERWGLGKRITATNVDKFGLYAIGQYCDAMVDDGRGGTEPRFACNAVINTFRDALDLLTALASSFRSMIYWSAGSVMLSQDAPTTVSRVLNPTNVQDGEFDYQNSSSYESKFSAVLVSWNDPNESYRLNTEVVEDPVLIEQLGWRPVEITAFGCTSQSMAHRVGLWALEDQEMADDVVQYIAGFDQADVEPGRVVATSDPRYTSTFMGGRIASGATTTVLPLDRDVTLTGGETYTLMVMQTDGTVAERTVSTGAGTVSSLTVSSAFPEAAPAGAVWALKSTSVEPRQWRIRSSKETDDGAYQMTGAIYDGTKYARVENGVNLEPLTFINLPTGPLTPPGGMGSIEYQTIDGDSSVPSLTVSVRPPQGDARVTAFDIQHKKPNTDRWIPLGQSSDISRDVVGVTPGDHEFRARSVDNAGRFSDWVGDTITVVAQNATLPEVGSPSVATDNEALATYLTWTKPEDVRPLRYEIFYHVSDTDVANAASLGLVDTELFRIQELGNYWIKTAYMDRRSSTTVMVEVASGDLPVVPRNQIDPTTITELEDATSAAAANAAAASQNATDIATNASNIAQEVIDRAAAVAVNANAIAQEITDRAAAVSAEASARSAADLVLTNDLASEVTAREQAVTRLEAKNTMSAMSSSFGFLNGDTSDWWDQQNGDPEADAPQNITNNGWTIVDDSTTWGAYAKANVPASGLTRAALRAVYPNIPGKKYKLTVEVLYTGTAGLNTTNSVSLFARKLNKDYIYTGGILSADAAGAAITAQNVWQEISIEVTCDGLTSWWRPDFYIRSDWGGDTASEIYLRTYKVEEIGVVATEIQASVTTEQTARITADDALAADITTLNADMGTAQADIITNANAIATETSARSSAITALQATIDLERYLNFNPDFEKGKQGWSSAYTSDGIGPDFPTTDVFSFSEVNPGGGAALRVTGYAYLASAWALKLRQGSGRRIRYRARVQTVTDTSNGNDAAFMFYWVGLDSNGDYVSAGTIGSSLTVVTQADGWVDIEHEFNTTDYSGSYSYLRPMFIIGGANSGAQSNATMDIQYFFVEDIEDVYAEGQARASAVSALDARVTTNEGAITSQASDITVLQTDVGQAQADIITNASAISTESSSRASQALLITSSFGRGTQAGQMEGQADPELIHGHDFVGRGSYNDTGATPAVVAADNNVTGTWTETTHDGEAVLQASEYTYLVTSWAKKLVAGQTTRYRFRVKCTSNKTNAYDNQIRLWVPTYDASWDFLASNAEPVLESNLEVADGWVEYYVDIADSTFIGAGAVYARAMVLVGGGSSSSSDAVNVLGGVYIEDVTDVADNAASAAQALSETSTNATAISANASAITALDARVTTTEGDISTANANITTNANAIATETSARATAIDALTASIERQGGSGRALNYNADMQEGGSGWYYYKASSGDYDDEYKDENNASGTPFAPIVNNSTYGRGLDFNAAGDLGANAAWGYNSRAFKVDPSRRYRVRARFYVVTPGTANGNVYTGIVTMDGNYQLITGGAGTHRYGPGPVSAHNLSAGDFIDFDWEITGEGDGSYQFRAGTEYARVMFITNYNGGDSRVIMLNLSVEDVTEASEFNETLSASITTESSARVAGDAAITAVTDVHQSRFESLARSTGYTFTFDDPTMWSRSISGAAGQKDLYADPSSYVTTVDGEPAYQQVAKHYIGPRYAMRCAPDEEIEVRVVAKVTANGTGSTGGSTFLVQAYVWNDVPTYITAQNIVLSVVKTTADGTFELVGTFNPSQSSGGARWFRPYVYFNTDDGAGENATINIFSMEIVKTERLATAEADIITNASTLATESATRADQTNLLRARLSSSNSGARFTFEDGFEDWMSTHEGDPETKTDPSGNWSVVDNVSLDSPWAEVTPDTNFKYIAVRPVYPNINGRKYRIRAKLWYTGTTGAGQGAIGIFGRKLTDTYVYAGAVLPSTSIQGTGGPGNYQFATAPTTEWVEFECEVTGDGTSKWFRPQLYTRGDWANPSGKVYLRELYVEELTPFGQSFESDISTAQADIITNASAIATESTARATQLNALRAQVGSVPGNIVYNPLFAEWDAGDTYPEGYSAWSLAGGTITRETTIVPAGQENAIRFSATSANNLGLQVASYSSTQGLTGNAEYTATKFLFEFDAYLESGSWDSVGVYTNHRSGPTAATSVAAQSLELNTVRTGLTTGKWYRFSVIVEETEDTSTADQMRIIVFANWSGFGGENVKELILGNLNVTPLNDDDDNAFAEIARQATVAANATQAVADDVTSLTATVGTNSADILDNATAIANETTARATQFESLSAAYGSNRFGDGEIDGVLDPFWAHGKDYYGQYRYGTSGADFDDVVANDVGPDGTIVDSDRGRALEITSYDYPFPAAAVKAIAGHRYRARFIWKTTVNTSNGNNNEVRGYILAYNSDYTSYSSNVTGATNVFFDANSTVGEGWQTGDIEFEGDAILDAGYLWMRPWLLIGGNSGAASNATNQILLMEIQDLTENAEVLFLREALSDASGNYASATLDTSAGAARAFIRMEAVDRDGVVDSNIGIGARRLEIYNPAGDEWIEAAVFEDGDLKLKGALVAGAGIFFGDGTNKWPVALQDEEYSLEDGDVVSYGVDFGTAAEITFSSEGLDPLGSGETYRLRAISSSGTGFTAELKILTPGTTSGVTENTNATTPSGPDQMIAKVETADAYDDNYTFQIDGTVVVTHTDELGGVDTYWGTISVETWFHDGTSWVQGPSKLFTYSQLGITPTHTNNSDQSYAFTNKQFTVSYTGTIRDSASLGTFGASAAYGGTVTELDQVTYTKQSVSGTRTASPNGEKAKVIVRPRNEA